MNQKTVPAFLFKFLQFLFFVLWLFFLAGGTVFAQAVPANDNCTGAILITPTVGCTTTNGSSVGATQSLLACGAGGVADDDVWFKFVATKNQHSVRITSSSGYDAVVEVFSGSCGNLNSLVCSDATSAGQPEIAQPGGLVIGNTYYVRVYHYKAGAGTGSFTICVSDPAFDYCEGAKELFSGPNCTPLNATLFGATQSFPSCNGGAANDVWFKFTATGTAHDVTVIPTSASLAMEAFSGNSCNSLSSLKCRTPVPATTGYTMELAPLIPGQTYFVRVYSFATPTAASTFSICLKDRPLPQGSICGDPVTMPAIPYSSGLQTTCGKGDYYRANFLNPLITGEEMVFKLEVTNAPVSYFVKLDKFTAAAKGLGVSVFKDCPNPVLAPANFIGDSPIGSDNMRDSSTVVLKTNGTYYFVVDQFGNNTGACGQFQLSVLPIPDPPVNDECAGAISLTVGKTCIPYNGSSVYATQSRPGCSFPNVNYPTNADDDVWFSFVAKSSKHKITLDDGPIIASYGQLGYNAVMELFSGACGNLTSIQCSYNTAGIIYDLDATNLIPGQTYYVRVYDRFVGWSNGHFTICVSEFIENDECAGAITLPVSPLNAPAMPLLTTSAGATQSMPACGQANQSFANDDVWFKFVATSPYQFIKVVGLDRDGVIGEFNFRPILELFSGSCGSLTSKVCTAANGYLNPGEIKASGLVTGQTYYARVYEITDNIYYSKFTIQVQEDVAPPPGALCTNAIPVSAFPFKSGTQTTCGSGNDYNSSCNAGGNRRQEMVFKLNVTNAPVAYQVTLRSGGQKKVAVFNGCPSPVSMPNNCVNGKYLINLADLFSTNLEDRDSVVTDIFNCPTNGTYYILVEDYDGNNLFSSLGTCGTFKLDVNVAPPAPANDACAAAVLLTSGTTCSPVAGTTINAAYSGGAGNCLLNNNSFDDDDVWYKFVATRPDQLVTVQGSTGFQAGIRVYSGSCTNLNLLSCAQPSGPANPANGPKIYYASGLTVGNTYYVKVFDQRHGFGLTGNFTICVTESTPRLPGIDCIKPFVIPAVPFVSGPQTTCGYGDDYAGFSSDSRTLTKEPSFYTYGEDFVYKLEVTNAPQTYAVHLGGSTKRKLLRIFKGCPIDIFSVPYFAPLTTGTDTSATGKYTFPTNGSYYIVVDNWADAKSPSCVPFRLTVTPAVLPTNDECAGAITLPVSNSCVYTTTDISQATNSMPGSCGNRTWYNTAINDVWYKFTAPATRHIKIELSGSVTFSGVVELFRGSCGAANLVTCPNFSNDSTMIRNFYDLVPGDTYFVRVYNNLNDFNGNGTFKICLTTENPPANGLCANAVSLPVNAVNVCNAVSGNSTGTIATPGITGCSGQADDNVWYKFTASNSHQRIKVTGTLGFDPVVQIFSGSCNNLVSMACLDNTSDNATENLDMNGLTAGQQYFVRVYHQGPGAGSGAFSICVQELPSPPVNDHCANATMLVSDTVCTTVPGTVLNATQSLPGCSGMTATDVWFKFTALGVENTITVTNTGNADLVMELLSGNCGAPSSVLCRDTSIAGGSERIKFAGTRPGDLYLIRVYAYNTDFTNGDFAICVKSSSVRAVVPQIPALTTFCAGSKFKLPFEAFGNFTSANTFTAQLSNAAGSFGNPMVVGSKFSSVSDTVLITLPATLPAGNNYQIRLVASSPGYTSPVLVPVTVLAIPGKPTFVTPPVYCSGEAIAAVNASGSNIKWYKDAQLTQLVHSGITFTPPALTDTTKYYITQTTTGCQSQPAIMTIIVKPKPNVFFTGLDSVYCAATQPITLVPAVGGGTFSGPLVFGNSFIPALAGTYTISYTRTENGCTATGTKKVKVVAGPPALVGTDKVICSGETVQIGTAPNPAFIYNWSPVAGISNPTIANPTFTGVNAGTKNDTIIKILQVTDPANGCTSSAFLKVIIRGGAPVMAGNDQIVCKNAAPMQLAGMPAGGTWSGSSSVNAAGIFQPQQAALGIHQLIYAVMQNGCMRTDTAIITVEALPNAQAGSNAMVCSGEPVTIGAAAVSGYTYTWQPASGLNNVAIGNPVFSLQNNSAQNDTITKILTVTNIASGCVNSDTIKIVVKPQVIANAGTDLVLCEGTANQQLTGTPAGGNWGGNGVNAAGLFDAVSAGIGSHKLYYTIQQNGCQAIDSVQITVASPPTAIAGPDAMVCSGETVNLGSAAVTGHTYSWSPVAGLNNAQVSNPVFAMVNSGTQNDTLVKILTVTNPVTGCSKTDTVQVIVKAKTTVSAGTDVSVCLNDAPVALNASPAGGNWNTHVGLNGQNFDPVLAGAGTHQLVYSASVNGCLNSDTVQITVISVPTPFVTLFGSDSLISTVSGSSYMWLLNGAPTGNSGAGIRPTQSGLYQVIVLNGNCASDTSATFNFIVNSIKNAENPANFKLFPNPTTGKTTLALTGSRTGKTSVILLDALGRKVAERAVKSSEKTVEFDWSGLPDGMYLLQVNSGEKAYFRKLVIQK